MRSRASRRKETRPTEEPPPVFYRIHALLHTMHAIERYEDQLCALMHEIQTSGSLSPIVSHELRDLLEDIPSEEYQHDLNAIREALQPAAPTSATGERPSRSSKVPPKKKTSPRKTSAKKTSAKKTSPKKRSAKKTAATRTATRRK